MKKIGCFINEYEIFSGNITTLQFSVQVRLIPNPQRASGPAPDYLLVQTKVRGYQPEIGYAWNCLSPEDNTPYLAVEIDDPTCHRPIHATLWEAENGLWYLFWNRLSTGSEDAEKLFIQEELKPPIGWHRAPQKMTSYLKELIPELVI